MVLWDGDESEDVWKCGIVWGYVWTPPSLSDGWSAPVPPRPSLTVGPPQVEFPEARIYEETLNILLYESQDGRGPDNALLEATGGAAGRSHHLDEDEERDRIERVRRIHIKRPDDRTHHHQ